MMPPPSWQYTSQNNKRWLRRLAKYAVTTLPRRSARREIVVMHVAVFLENLKEMAREFLGVYPSHM